MQVPPCRLQHAGGGLAARAGNFQVLSLAGESAVGMVGAVVQPIDVGPLVSQQRLHAVVDAPEGRLVAFPPGHDGLVRDDHGQHAGAIQPTHGGGRSRQQAHVLDLRQKPHLLVEHAVPIQEDGPLGQPERLGGEAAGTQVSLGGVEAFRGAHVLDVLRACIGGDARPRPDHQGEEILCEVGGRGRVPEGGEGVLAHAVEGGVDEVAVCGPLGVRIGVHAPHESLVVHVQEVGIPRVVVGVGEEGDSGGAVPVEGDESVQVHVEQRVAVHHQEFVLQSVEGVKRGSGRALRDAVLHEIHGDAGQMEAMAELPDGIGPMGDQQCHATHAEGGGVAHLAFQQRRALQGDEGFRQESSVGESQAFGKSRALASAEDDELGRHAPSCLAISSIALRTASRDPRRGVNPSAAREPTS